MKVTVELTKHKTTLSEQFEKVTEEYNELKEELTKDTTETTHIIQEAIDVAKASLKLAYDLSNKLNFDFDVAIATNDFNNNLRGYNGKC